MGKLIVYDLCVHHLIYTFLTDLDFGAHRQRSNTAQRLEKMEREWKKAAKIKHVKWENPQQALSNSKFLTLFCTN
jgi:hypothetical protein